MKTLYIECSMGAAGDMLMAALYELLDDKQAFLDAFAARRLTYGDIEGRPDLLSGIAKLYRTVAPRTSRSSTRRAPRCLTLPVPRSPWTPL